MTHDNPINLDPRPRETEAQEATSWRGKLRRRVTTHRLTIALAATAVVGIGSFQAGINKAASDNAASLTMASCEELPTSISHMSAHALTGTQSLPETIVATMGTDRRFVAVIADVADSKPPQNITVDAYGAGGHLHETLTLRDGDCATVTFSPPQENDAPRQLSVAHASPGGGRITIISAIDPGTNHAEPVVPDSSAKSTAVEEIPLPTSPSDPRGKICAAATQAFGPGGSGAWSRESLPGLCHRTS